MPRCHAKVPHPLRPWCCEAPPRLRGRGGRPPLNEFAFFSSPLDFFFVTSAVSITSGRPIAWVWVKSTHTKGQWAIKAKGASQQTKNHWVRPSVFWGAPKGVCFAGRSAVACLDPTTRRHQDPLVGPHLRVQPWKWKAAGGQLKDDKQKARNDLKLGVKRC